MEKIHDLATALADACEEAGVPLLAAYGVDRISVVEIAPECAPEILKKARAVLFNSTSRARRRMEIEG